MIDKKFHWLKLAFQLKGSIVLAIYRRVLACGFFGILVSLLYSLKFPVSQPIFESVIPSIVLGLLLVFRTNTAYDRFWEGRKCWGSMVNNTRNLARQILVSIDEITPEDKKNKIVTLYLLVGFSVATKLHLRGEPVNSELEELVGHSRYLKLKNLNNPPLKIAFWISDYLERQYKRNCLNNYQLIAIQDLLNNLVDNLGACERILKTPIPLAYAIHLKQLLLIYCLLLPFQIVEIIGWWTGLFTALVSFTLFGIEAIALEIENPFGHDPNDLQLDTICNTMKRNIDDLINFNPYVRSHHDNITN